MNGSDLVIPGPNFCNGCCALIEVCEKNNVDWHVVLAAKTILGYCFTLGIHLFLIYSAKYK